jgi:hypothetical protein
MNCSTLARVTALCNAYAATAAAQETYDRARELWERAYEVYNATENPHTAATLHNRWISAAVAMHAAEDALNAAKADETQACVNTFRFGAL